MPDVEEDTFVKLEAHAPQHEHEHELVHKVNLDLTVPDVKPVDDVKPSLPSPSHPSPPALASPRPPSHPTSPRPADEKPATLDALFSPASPRRPSPPPLSRTNSVKFDLPEDDANGYGYDEWRDRDRESSGSAGPSSRATSAGPSGSSRRKKESTPPRPPMLIPDLPLAWDDALGSFDSLERCVYERKDLGLSREQDDMMVCDCTYDPGESAYDPGCESRPGSE